MRRLLAKGWSGKSTEAQTTLLELASMTAYNNRQQIVVQHERQQINQSFHYMKECVGNPKYTGLRVNPSEDIHGYR